MRCAPLVLNVAASHLALSKPGDLSAPAGEELSRGAALNLFVPPREGAQVKSELEAVASSVAALAGPSLAAAAAAAAQQPQQSAGQPENLIEQTMQALAKPAQPTAAAPNPQTGHGVSPGNPPSYPY